MTSTREHQIKFIKSFGTFNAIEKLVLEMLASEGVNFLTDDQIKAMTSKRVRDARYTQHHNMRERKKAVERRTLVYLDAGVSGRRNYELKSTGSISPQAAE